MSFILIKNPFHPLRRRHYKFLHLRRYYLLYFDLQPSITNKLWQISEVFRTQNFGRTWNFDETVSPCRENFRVVMNVQCDILLLDFQFRSVTFQNSRELIIRTFPSLDSNRCLLEHFRSNTRSSLNCRGNDTSEQAALRLRGKDSCDQHFDKVPIPLAGNVAADKRCWHALSGNWTRVCVKASVYFTRSRNMRLLGQADTSLTMHGAFCIFELMVQLERWRFWSRIGRTW